MNLQLVLFPHLTTPLAGGTAGVWLKTPLCHYHRKKPGELLRCVATVIDAASCQAVTAVGSILDYSSWPRFGSIMKLWPTSIEPLSSIDHLQTGDIFALFSPAGNNCRCPKLTFETLNADFPFWHTGTQIPCNNGTCTLANSSQLHRTWFVTAPENLPIEPKNLKHGDMVQVLSPEFVGYAIVSRVNKKLVVKRFNGPSLNGVVDVKKAALFLMPSTGIISF